MFFWVNGRAVEPLPAGASPVSVGSSVTIPVNAGQGAYYIIAGADANGEVVEALETNTRSTAVIVFC